MKNNRARRFILILGSLLCGPVALAANYTYSVACGTANHTVTTSTATLLVGGAEAGATGEVEATQWLLNNAKGGDYLVLRTGGTGGQASWVCSNFGSSIGSAAELSIDNRTGANDATVAQKIRDAEIIFIAGGDQNKYEDYWKDTAVETALNDHVRVSREPIGGTSAGLAILGQSYYAPAGTGVLSKEILDNPFHTNTRDINHGDFLLHPQLANVITDTHLNRITGSGRNAETRHGRVLGFLARSVAARNTLDARAIGVDEGTFIALDGSGNAKVYGIGRAYFLKPNVYPERIQSGSTLIWNSGNTAVTVYWIQGSRTGNGSFSFTNWSGTGGTQKYWYTSGGYSGFNCQRGC
ncbi:type 1 glutamine amidotransferase-like domain-containing protein [Permianibacter sp. IMCC34836]|uniref:cyanophycinase n=1 Tax=Permianibacter fluminis TaxID=2738515 RepID=UPI00155325D1|nr:Type 1 glutamine amidotransferase-like domain-containing protein [Permianibacter fluminis]NQD35919.1 type 1 glutamine amidotransferase-like domain-containing protein [Permianibacter fluminis]